mmetsp:Transcript_9159/g.24832  ORF Transcript_9159/g.24832 Transcript_9159/m.24832 type:complete len:81 (+) Transcript_9159:349-591(+)
MHIAQSLQLDLQSNRALYFLVAAQDSFDAASPLALLSEPCRYVDMVGVCASEYRSVCLKVLWLSGFQVLRYEDMKVEGRG